MSLLVKLLIGNLVYLSSAVVLANSVGTFDEPFVMTWLLQPTSLDPHSEYIAANETLARHIFDPLFILDQDGQEQANLVQSFKVESPLKWHFTLKQGITFHDGSPLTSHDVIATFQRIAEKGKENVYYHKYKGWKLAYISPLEFTITTPNPNPELIKSLIYSFIIKQQAVNADSKAFDDMTFAIGTGPYRLLRQENLKRFSLSAFNAYHRGAAYLQQVEIKIDTDRKRRMDAFFWGETDFIDEVTIEELQQARQHKSINFTTPTSYWVYVLFPDAFNDRSPDIRDLQGNPLNHNPLKDLRVRQAISKAINRFEIVEQVYGDPLAATPAGQLIPKGNNGASNRILPERQNITKAKRLLAEAGYPHGFALTLYGNHSRRKLLTSIAAMMSQAGIQTQVETMPSDDFFPRLLAHEFSLAGFLYHENGNLGEMLRMMIQSRSSLNAGRYSNPIIDQQLKEASQEYNEDLRQRKYRYISELVIDDLAVIPIVFSNDIWLIRSDMVFNPDGSRLTSAYHVGTAKILKVTK